MKGILHKFSAIAVSGALTLGCSFSSFAGDVVETPPQLSSLIDKGVVKVVETFKHDSFTGWLVDSSGEHHLYWATEDNYIIAGPLIDKDSVNLTDKYLAEKKPVPDYNNVLADFEKEGLSISTHPDGGAEGVIYVFAEPFCGWCSRLHAGLEHHIENGLEVRWIPVSFLSGQSEGVIQYFLNAEDPYKAMQQHEALRASRSDNYNLATPTAATRNMIQKNGDFMRRFGIAGTPGIVYKLNGKVRTSGYMPPEDLERFVSAIKVQ